MPLYLEWAPVNVFRSAADAKAGSLNRKQETAGILHFLTLLLQIYK